MKLDTRFGLWLAFLLILLIPLLGLAPGVGATRLLNVVAAYILLAEKGVGGTNPVYLLVRAANAWCWLLTFMGFAGQHLNRSSRFLQYANEAVLPFYILHQTVIVAIGYFIKSWNWAVFPKYLFLAVTSFLLIIGVYEFVVRRVRFLRFLFGMKV
jgi:hypothetical protein